MNDLKAKEEKADECIQAGKTDEAVAHLLELVRGYAQKKDFVKAEAFREKILAVNDMALTEIIQAAEVIEHAKSEAMDPNHMALWKDLYQDLTQDEANELYFALELIEVDPDQTLIHQGQPNSHLFLIEKGELKRTYRHQQEERLMRNLAMGDAAGTISFFNLSVSTVSLTALTTVTLRRLAQERFEHWKQTMPGLSTKLEKYCLRAQESYAGMEARGIDRREHKRLETSGVLAVQLLNSAKAKVGRPFKGDLVNVSRGGLCFEVRLVNPKMASTLLGRHAWVEFAITAKGNPKKISRTGVLIAIIQQAFEGYMIHMRFDPVAA